MAETPEEDSTYEFAPKEEAAAPPREDAAPELAEPVARKRRPAPTPAPPAPLQPPEPPVERTCPHCGYSYFGKPKARCPDCAAPAESAKDLLQFSSHAWVRTVALGLMLTALAMVGHVAGAILLWVPDQIRSVQVHLAAAVLLVIAVFVATWGEGTMVSGSATTRWLARLAALAALLPWVALAVIILRNRDPDALLQFRRTIKLLVIVELAIQAFLAVVMGFYATHLAIRVPSDTLAIQSKTTGWLAGVVCLVLLGIQFFDMTERTYYMMFMCSFPMVVGLLVILAWGMITLMRLGFDMRQAATAGELITVRRMERIAAKKRPPPGRDEGIDV